MKTRKSATKSWLLHLKKYAELIWEEKTKSWIENPIEQAYQNTSYLPNLAGEKTREIRCEINNCQKTFIKKKAMKRRAREANGCIGKAKNDIEE